MVDNKILLIVCKSLIEERDGKTWRNFYLNKSFESKGYTSKRTYFTCHVSYDDHPHCDKIYSGVVNVTPAQIRNKKLELLLKN